MRISGKPRNYDPVANVLGLASLTERRRIAGITFLNGLLSNKVDFPVIVSLLYFKVPQYSTQTTTPFYVPHSTTNYMLNELIKRFMYYAYVNHIPSS